MLGKLLKYEFKATARIFLLMYVALFAVAGLNALVIPYNGNTLLGFLDLMPTLRNVITSLAVILYVLLTIAVLVVTLVIVVIRFYRMLGDEGYLWFTLPVTANQHIISKLLVGLVWSVASFLVVMLSVLVLTLPAGWIGELWRLPELSKTIAELNLNPGLWTICLFAIVIVSYLSSILMCYAAMAVGPNFIKSRLGGSVLAYIIMYVGTQILSTVELLVLAGPVNTQAQRIADLAYQLDTSAMTSAVSQMGGAIDQIVLISTATYCIGYLVLVVVFYLITRFFLTQKLNLA